MKRINKKGFTLIELLAIIVILAIIAVITVPLILGVIDEAKKGTAKDSAYGYKDAINKLYTTSLMNDEDYSMDNKTYTPSQLTDLGLSISGKEPESNSWIVIEDNDIKSACLQFDEYKVDIIDGIVGEAQKSECEEAPKSFAVLTNDSDNSGTITPGDLVCISKTSECFYVINSNSTKTVLLSRYNLNVGYEFTCTEGNSCQTSNIVNPTGLQDIESNGGTNYRANKKGLIEFSSSNYWANSNFSTKEEYLDKYPDVYDSNSVIFPIVEDYVEYLKGADETQTISGRLMTLTEAEGLGCGPDNANAYIRYCDNAPEWVYSSSYWLGTVSGAYSAYVIEAYGSDGTNNNSYLNTPPYNDKGFGGVRPVIEISTSSIGEE